jgi:hypothetical protein
MEKRNNFFCPHRSSWIYVELIAIKNNKEIYTFWFFIMHTVLLRIRSHVFFQMCSCHLLQYILFNISLGAQEMKNTMIYRVVLRQWRKLLFHSP